MSGRIIIKNNHKKIGSKRKNSKINKKSSIKKSSKKLKKINKLNNNI
jgi:hypothetical protein